MRRALIVHLLQLNQSDWVCISCVAGIVATVLWLGWECTGMRRAIEALRVRLSKVESRQDRLQALVQRKDWRDSLDLTRWDWSKK